MTISKFTKEEINSIKTSANRFDVNIIIPNSDKNFKSIAYLNTEEGIDDLYNISKAEKFCSDNSFVSNKKGVMTKNGDLYKKNLAKFDIGYLALTIGKERPNRTYQNAIRRLSDNEDYSKEKAIEMLNSEFGKKNCQKFIHPNTLITKLDKYLKELNSSDNSDNSESDNSEEDNSETSEEDKKILDDLNKKITLEALFDALPNFDLKDLHLLKDEIVNQIDIKTKKLQGKEKIKEAS
mgnify:CR=1 FL=1|tara:strand:- start:69 stop:779 length:711 start_codon:yes stop_codon:yes gene_type:complete